MEIPRIINLIRAARKKLRYEYIRKYVYKKYTCDPAKKISYVAQRQASKLRATPKWANKSLIEQFYRQCVMETVRTGITHHVDHIIPLRSPKVCGLHCEFNLQVLSAKENIKKSIQFQSDW